MSFRRRTNETIADLQRQVEVLRTQRAEAAAAPAPPAPPAPPSAGTDGLAPPEPGTSLTDLHDLVQGLAGRVDVLDGRQRDEHERLSQRIEELTAQFRNQLSELGNELDSGHQQIASQLAAQEQRLEELSASGGDDDRQDALLAELRSNQVKIANDLARHEIAFRQDLAGLADLVHRSRRS